MTGARGVALVALLAAACGRPDDIEVRPAAVESGPLASLRLLGVPGGYVEAKLGVASVVVKVNGSEVPVVPGAREVDLANGAHAWLLGQFAMPPPDATIAVAVTLADCGVFDMGFRFPPGEGSDEPSPFGLIAVRRLPLLFTVSGATFAPRGHAVVQIDLARSLIPLCLPGQICAAQSRELIPQLRVLD